MTNDYSEPEQVYNNTNHSSIINWLEETEDELELPGPDFITYGCWVKVLNEKENKQIMYHLPLKNDKSRKWFGIEEKLLGQVVGYRIFISGKYYRVLAFGRDD